mmetsp:Transcript_5954/g.13618  ORF Transcript_5954/g.13618 Transcript_5954/m.13618 type:complete len:253 (-) Transcript_5954:710-1468(-)
MMPYGTMALASTPTGTPREPATAPRRTRPRLMRGCDGRMRPLRWSTFTTGHRSHDAVMFSLQISSYSSGSGDGSDVGDSKDGSGGERDRRSTATSLPIHLSSAKLCGSPSTRTFQRKCASTSTGMLELGAYFDTTPAYCAAATAALRPRSRRGASFASERVTDVSLPPPPLSSSSRDSRHAKKHPRRPPVALRQKASVASGPLPTARTRTSVPHAMAEIPEENVDPLSPPISGAAQVTSIRPPRPAQPGHAR